MNMVSIYNRNRLREKLKQVEPAFLGLKTPVSRFVCGEDGLASNEKIQELADRVINYECYINSLYVGMNGTRRRFYELLFYLILRTYDPKDTVFDFEDFINVAKELCGCYTCREELLLRETKRIGIEIPRMFYSNIRYSCEILTGKLLTTDMSKEELDNIEASYKQKKATYAQKKKELERVYALDEAKLNVIKDKYKDYSIVGEVDYLTAMEEAFCLDNMLYISEEDKAAYDESDLFDKKQGRYLTRQEEKNFWENEPKEREKWLNSFENPAEYLEAYKEFSELVFYVDVFSGEQNLEDSILAILEKEKLNKVGDDEKHLKLMSSLDKSLRIARNRS